jgi:hypothetical protein
MRRAATAAISAAVVIALGPAPPATATARPPTSAAIERATERFLATAPAAERPPRSGGVAPTPVGELLPANRVVAFYGAPQMGQTVLGMNSPPAAARKLAAQSKPYSTLSDRPVVGEFDLVSVFATAGGGSDGLYRMRQSPDVIQIYLDQARAAGSRLMLDIQPGRSTFSTETAALAGWLAQPDVDLALDPEWNVGRRGIPGQTSGKVGARQVNAVIRSLAAIVRQNALPPKLLVVHQFRRGMIRGKSRIRPRRGVQVLLNFDGIGSPPAKAVGYASLSSPTLFNGFSLFYQRDTPVMKPGAVLGLEPEPDLLLYQ